MSDGGWIKRPNADGYWWMRRGGSAFAGEPYEIVRVEMRPWDDPPFAVSLIGEEGVSSARDLADLDTIEWQRVTTTHLARAEAAEARVRELEAIVAELKAHRPTR